MAPLIVLVLLFASLVWPLGWWDALRYALAGMFLLTASAHWGTRRADLIRMVPSSLPRPDLLVTLTGVCELLGVAGLLVARVAPYAAIGLTLLLLAIFPANVRAAREGLTIAGQRTPPLVIRALIQIVFLAATMAVAIGARR